MARAIEKNEGLCENPGGDGGNGNGHTSQKFWHMGCRRSVGQGEDGGGDNWGGGLFIRFGLLGRPKAGLGGRVAGREKGC